MTGHGKLKSPGLSQRYTLIDHLPAAMASVASVTKQIAALELSAKPQSSRPGHTKQQSSSSNSNVAKLLTKFAAPNPFPTSTSSSSTSSKPLHPSSLRNPLPTKQTAPTTIDIGRYDGGFELENEKRGEKVYGEAAEDLALDSSVAR